MKLINKNTIFIGLVFLSTSLFSQKTIKKYADKNLSQVKYSMSHPMHDWDGINKSTKAVIVEDTETQLVNRVGVFLKLIDFNSENANRDSHAIEILDGIKYPTVTFLSSKIVTNEDGLSVKGTLTFHNVKKEITVPVSYKKENGKTFYTGNFDIDMTDYNVKKPTLMNIPTDKIIKINFSFAF